MNYGKTAYLKILDLEKELSTQQADNNYNSYLEIIKSNINETISNNSKVELLLPEISVTTNKTICFQIKLTTNTISNGDILTEILVDDINIFSETKHLSIGQSDYVFFKTFTPITTKNITTKIILSTHSNTLSTQILNSNIIILGAKGEEASVDIEMNAIQINEEENALISFIDSNKLYYSIEPITKAQLNVKNFKFLLPAISHCFCNEGFISETNQNPKTILFRVSPEKNLYFSYIFDQKEEILIDSNVSYVNATQSPLITGDSVFISYIKEGNCYYSTIKEGKLLKSKKLQLPSGTYKKIHPISHKNSDFIYLIASNTNGSNYIVRSLIEATTGKIVEHLKTDYKISITKYIDLSFIKDKTVETLKTDLTFNLKGIIDYDKIFKRIGNENLSASYKFTSNTYKVGFEGIYGVKLDKSNLVAGQWESYTDDASDFEGAYIDVNSGLFEDNGWKDRWPFNEIRPVFMTPTGEVVDGLNPDNYAQYEDGSAAFITNRQRGGVFIEIPKILAITS